MSDFVKLIYRVSMFFFFSLLVATPYLIFHLNQLSSTNYFSSLFSTILKGALIGLSTIWDTLKRLSLVISTPEYGTIIFSAVLLVLASSLVYYLIRADLTPIEMRGNKSYSGIVIFLVAFVLTAFLIAPISYAVSDGETILSGVSFPTEKHLEIFPSLNITLENKTEIPVINLLEE